MPLLHQDATNLSRMEHVADPHVEIHKHRVATIWSYIFQILFQVYTENQQWLLYRNLCLFIVHRKESPALLLLCFPLCFCFFLFMFVNSLYYFVIFLSVN